jgi:uncharacterized protein (DUF924 family)
MSSNDEIQAVLDFWFGEPASTTEQLGTKVARWFRAGASLDGEVKEKFGALIEQAVGGALTEWEATTEGSLALIILLDQLTRHAYRDSPRMYDGDARAQRLVLALFDSGAGRTLRTDLRHFAIMPLLHSEHLTHQQRAVAEHDALTAEAPAFWKPMLAMGHEQTRKFLEVVTRFGRFPHRNAILGRTSTPEEKAFLETYAHGPQDSAKKFAEAAKPPHART